MKKDNKCLTCIDLFAGAGGFSLGVSQAGFNVVAAVAKKCFQVNGFTKEEIKEVWWNTKLWIQMKEKTTVEKVDQAINECLVDGMAYILKNNLNKKTI